jgi:hypothetical protein
MNKGPLLGTVGLIVVLTLAYVAHGRREPVPDPRSGDPDADLADAEEDGDPGRSDLEGGVDEAQPRARADGSDAGDAEDDDDEPGDGAPAGAQRRTRDQRPVRGAADVEMIEEEDDPGEVVELPKTIEDHEDESVEAAEPEAAPPRDDAPASPAAPDAPPPP